MMKIYSRRWQTHLKNVSDNQHLNHIAWLAWAGIVVVLTGLVYAFEVLPPWHAIQVLMMAAVPPVLEDL